jgi:hypothetical protein
MVNLNIATHHNELITIINENFADGKIGDDP